jgi:hypothetical protein
LKTELKADLTAHRISDNFETVLTVLYILFFHFITGTGWFTTDPWEITEKFGGQWKTSDFKATLIMKSCVIMWSHKTRLLSNVGL